MSGRNLLIVALVIAFIVVGAVFFPVRLPHIQLAAEPIAHLGELTIYNTMLTGWIASLIVLWFFWSGTRNQQLVPRGMQNFVEMAAEFVITLCESVAGPGGRRFFPLIGTIFFFVITANWMGLLPGVGTIGVWEEPHAAEELHVTAAQKEGAEVVPAKDDHGPVTVAANKEQEADAAHADDDHANEPVFVPLFRAATSDLNTTLAIALVSVIATQIVGIRTLRGEYVQRFFNIKGGPVGIYVGLLELIGEFARVLSFTFRLFGNVFAGEVLLVVITFLVPWVVVLPFMGLELFVGFIQAFVFAMITLVFLYLATISHEHHDEEHDTVATHGGGAPH